MVLEDHPKTLAVFVNTASWMIGNGSLLLDAINKAAAREKSIRHGHPSTLHLWWARRPLATARAVIFAQMVDDPSEHPDLFPTGQAQEKERQRLLHWPGERSLSVLARQPARAMASTRRAGTSAPPPQCPIIDFDWAID